MNCRKTAALLLASAMIFSFAGCKKSPGMLSSGESETASGIGNRDYITLLYSSSDAFNPYTVTTDINRQLCRLLYEPLVKLTNEFKPVYSVAAEIKNEDKECTVTLAQLKFSDGTAVTADDVIYSYKLAVQSEGVYSSRLYEVESATARDSKSVVFKLKKSDPYFENLLDFPIIKAESEKAMNSDSVLQPPIGCGRFKVSDDRQSLVENEMYAGSRGSIKSIRLINAPDSESVSHYVEVGAADAFYNDIADGQIIRMSGKKHVINLNNLVYIGINRNYGALAQNALRQAISAGINRTDICANSFYNNALPATGFFNPVWEPVQAVQNIQIEANSQITVENLEQIGYNKLNGKNERINSSGNTLKFTLLVNSENRLRVAAAQRIASQLSDYGIKITVIEKSYKDYTECLKSGSFQLFLGEVRLTENMDISCMLTKGGSVAYGLPDGTKAESDGAESAEDSDGETSDTAESTGTAVGLNQSAEVLEGFYSGKNSVTDVAAVLQTEMPFVPVCYRTGALFVNDNIENVIDASASDVYFSIESYIYKE